MPIQKQQITVSDDEFLNLLEKAEFYKNLSKEDQQRLALIIFAGTDEMKASLLDLINSSNEDFANLKNKFLSSEYQILNEISIKITEAKNIYNKNNLIKTEDNDRNNELSSLDNLLTNL